MLGSLRGELAPRPSVIFRLRLPYSVAAWQAARKSNATTRRQRRSKPWVRPQEQSRIRLKGTVHQASLFILNPTLPLPLPPNFGRDQEG